MTQWLVAAVAAGFFLLGLLSAGLIYQMIKNAHLEGRIHSIGTQLRNVPKRKGDRVEERA